MRFSDLVKSAIVMMGMTLITLASLFKFVTSGPEQRTLNRIVQWFHRAPVRAEPSQRNWWPMEKDTDYVLFQPIDAVGLYPRTIRAPNQFLLQGEGLYPRTIRAPNQFLLWGGGLYPRTILAPNQFLLQGEGAQSPLQMELGFNLVNEVTRPWRGALGNYLDKVLAVGMETRLPISSIPAAKPLVLPAPAPSPEIPRTPNRTD